MRKTNFWFVLFLATLMIPGAASAQHNDIAPYFQGGKLLTGGLDHLGNHVPPPIRVYGYDFGEEPLDPFNVADPGVNQASGTGSLPGGATLRYNILSNLYYWNDEGAVGLYAPPANSLMTLTMGAASRTLDVDSGLQTGSLIQTVTSGGVVHKHFAVSLYDSVGASNIPGEPGYIEPVAGIYSFSVELTLTDSGTLYTSDPLWIVFNNGETEEIHDTAIEYIQNNVVPEPAGLSILALGGTLLLRRQRRSAVSR